MEIAVISGKGGTGKTTVAALLGAHAAPAVMVDADVDAANLALLLQPRNVTEEPFYGGQVARIDPERCRPCGACEAACRFGAIAGGVVNPVLCEGCGACYQVCPEGAVSLEPSLDGYTYGAEGPFGPVVYAELTVGRGNSGRLVAAVREQARAVAGRAGISRIVIDGPPGTGCPVIAAVSRVSLVLVVTEPTKAAFHDLDRVLGVVRHFGVPAAVCINRCDLHPGYRDAIREHCRAADVPVVGELPTLPEATRALVAEKPLCALMQTKLALMCARIWRRIAGLGAEAACGPR
ncbi:MAG: 4Fe-4S binding protein [Firmicutes bacterium]|nr:4Fe-4S binding protein [Bacillota bacterium]